jgi:hypothetical protein
MFRAAGTIPLNHGYLYLIYPLFMSKRQEFHPISLQIVDLGLRRSPLQSF